MAPEQIAASKDVDARVDIWSMGVTLYELLTGHPAFEGKTLVSLYTEITLKQPIPMSHYRSDLPLGLGSVVARCIQKEREDRYGDVAELACALKPFASGECGVQPEILASVLGRPSLGSLSSMPPSSNRREPLLKWVGTNGGESMPAPSQASTASRAPNDHVLGWLLLALVFTIAVVIGAIVLLRGPGQAMLHPPHSATSHAVRK
jgi:serine/threonine-protein kinase